MKRREFITLLGGAAAAWPTATRAQQTGAMRRIGVLMGWSESDPEYRGRLVAFVQVLSQAGWTQGQNIQLDVRWTNGDVERARILAKELVARQPDVILVGTTPATAAVQRETNTIPVVFSTVSDPVGAGFVASLPRPGGNLTGFINLEAAMGGKWLELLKEVAPALTRVAMMFNPNTAPGGGSYFLGSFEVAARALAVEPLSVRVHSDAEIEAGIGSLGDKKSGLVVMTDSFMSIHRSVVIASAARNSVPSLFEGAVYPKEGALIGYGVNNTDLFRRAATYVDRILRGAKPGDLPVEVPTKFDLVINLMTAKALGLTIPLGLQAAADELIE